jgi:hypothetical protein
MEGWLTPSVFLKTLTRLSLFMEGPMKPEWRHVFALAVLLISSAARSAGEERPKPTTLALDKLELHNVKAEPVTYLGRAAVRVTDADPHDLDDAGRLAVLPGSAFQNGTIELNVSGDTAAAAAANLRGFVGIAFQITADRSHFECFYLRPKNGRAENQLQRNHSVQDISYPVSDGKNFDRKHQDSTSPTPI